MGFIDNIVMGISAMVDFFNLATDFLTLIFIIIWTIAFFVVQYYLIKFYVVIYKQFIEKFPLVKESIILKFKSKSDK